MPDAAWPALPNYRTFSQADHAAHRSPKGVAYPETLMPSSNVDSRKAAKGLMKAAHKKHLKMTKTPTRTIRRKRKQR